MTVLAITALIFGVAVLAMSVGVLFGREPIRGSCGGVVGSCDSCTRICSKRADAASTAEEAT